MVSIDEPAEEGVPELLQFGCPACRAILSISGAQAGIEGPCPFCATRIAAPVPQAGLAARRMDVPVRSDAAEAPASEELPARRGFRSASRPRRRGPGALDPPARETQVLDRPPPPPADLPGAGGISSAPPEPGVSVPASPAAGAPPEPVARVEAVPVQLQCQRCGIQLTIDPALAHLPGGPCPRCHSWIDLSPRHQPEEAWPEPRRGGPAIPGKLTEVPIHG